MKVDNEVNDEIEVEKNDEIDVVLQNDHRGIAWREKLGSKT
jgi:hypothetical protein